MRSVVTHIAEAAGVADGRAGGEWMRVLVAAGDVAGVAGGEQLAPASPTDLVAARSVVHE